ncbi:hypothetical protein OROMI_014097 [Orobanche minor]
MKQVKTCRFCKETGHNYTTCSQKENIEDITSSQPSHKRSKSAIWSENLNPIFHIKY